MNPKQLELPIFIPNVWKSIKQNHQNEAITIMAKMIIQHVEPVKREDDNEKSERSKNI